jgi:hypothetical protein
MEHHLPESSFRTPPSYTIEMAKLLRVLCFAPIIWVVAHALDTRTDQSSLLPVVDLGYGIYQASFNVRQKSTS